MFKSAQDDVTKMNQTKELELINANLAHKVAALDKANSFQQKGLVEYDISEEVIGQTKLLEDDINHYKQKYKDMTTWKQTHGNKMNFQKFKELTDAQKLNQDLRKRKMELGLDAGPSGKLLPIEIEMEKRKRKGPYKYDEQKKKDVLQQQNKHAESRIKEGKQKIDNLRNELDKARFGITNSELIIQENEYSHQQAMVIYEK